MKDDQNHKNLDWIGSFKKKKVQGLDGISDLIFKIDPI